MNIQLNSPEKKRDYFYIAIIVSCICALLQLYALPRANVTLISLSNRVLLLVWVAVGGAALLLKLREPFPQKLVSALLILLFSVLSYLCAVIIESSDAFEKGMQLLGFWVLPLMLLYSAFFKVNEKARLIMLIFHILASVIFIQLYHSNMRHLYVGEYGEQSIDAVTLGYDNPNQTAMYLLVCVIGLLSGVFYFKSVITKTLLAADTAYIMWIMLQTESRTAQLLLVVLAVLLVLTLRWRISNIWITVTLLIPLIYVLLPLLGADVINLKFLDDLFFNGREEIYFRYFDRLNIFSVFVGDMNTFSFENLHNGYVAIAASVGIPVCLLYVNFLRVCLKLNLPDNGSAMFERVAFVGFLCLVMLTSVEAAFFVGGSNFAFLVFSIYALFAKPYTTEQTQ